MRIALVGNQNCGKSTLFNVLTGAHQKVGNFPGVTVTGKTGSIIGHPDWFIVDLPGIYSLTPYTQEEMVTRDELLRNRPDCIINIVDGMHLDRHLYLTMQLLAFGIPLILAVNMIDEVEKYGGILHIEKLQASLHLPVVAISASTQRGIAQLCRLLNQPFNPPPQTVDDPYLRDIQTLLKSSHLALPCSLTYAATQILEGHVSFREALSLDATSNQQIDQILSGLSEEGYSYLARLRYQHIEQILQEAKITMNQTAPRQKTLALDAFCLHSWFGWILLSLLLGGIFFFSFALAGNGLGNWLFFMIQRFSQAVMALPFQTFFMKMLVQGLCLSLGGIISFLPVVLSLLACLGLLEDTGYMARAAVLVDPVLQKCGLSGRSFFPLVLGLGCSVPAVMATRTIRDQPERKRLIRVIPLISCSAKLPVYTLLAQALYGSYDLFVICHLYLLGFVLALLSASCSLARDSSFLLLELPDYRRPTIRQTLQLIKEKAQEYLKKTFTILFLVSLISFLLARVDFHLKPVTNAEASMLACLSRLLLPLFEPMGLTDWRPVAALIAGLSAKEAIISTLLLLSGKPLKQLFSPASGYAFLLFVLLYSPCVASLTTVKKETQSFPEMLRLLLGHTIFAWLVAVAVYQLAQFLI